MGQVLGADVVPPIVKASATTLTLATTYLGKTTRITVGGQQYVPPATITLNFATVGFNGIDTGVISATSAVYNIYAVVQGGVLGMIASLSDFDVGPSGFTIFKKLGEVYASNSVLAEVPTAITTTTAIYDSADANVTWSNSFDRRIVVNGLTASRDRTLPSTGVVSGDEFRIENTTAFDLVIRSSNGSALTVANGANFDATINKGFVLLRATQSSPTTPAHWQVVDVYDNGFYTGTTSGAIVDAAGVKWSRRNRVVSVEIGCGQSAASASPSIVVAATNNPLRIRPTLDKTGAGMVVSGSTTIVGLMTATSSGTFIFNKYDFSNFTSNAAIGNSGGPVACMSYQLGPASNSP